MGIGIDVPILLSYQRLRMPAVQALRVNGQPLDLTESQLPQ